MHTAEAQAQAEATDADTGHAEDAEPSPKYSEDESDSNDNSDIEPLDPELEAPNHDVNSSASAVSGSAKPKRKVRKVLTVIQKVGLHCSNTA